MTQPASTVSDTAGTLPKPESSHHNVDATLDRFAEKAHKTVDDVLKSAKPVADRVMENAEEFQHAHAELLRAGREYVKTRPLLTAAFALGMGYLLGKIAG